MKKLTTALFAVLCLFVLTGVTVASETPGAATPETLDLLAVEQSTEANDCDATPAAALDGQEPTSLASNNCSVGCSVSQCQGKARGGGCFTGSGWGACNLYLGYQCSDGTGWDCVCYRQGGAIP